MPLPPIPQKKTGDSSHRALPYWRAARKPICKRLRPASRSSPARGRTRPGLAPVCLPSRSTCDAVDEDVADAGRSCCGLSKVAWSWIVAGSKTTTSAIIAGASATPRSLMPRLVAGKRGQPADRVGQRRPLSRRAHICRAAARNCRRRAGGCSTSGTRPRAPATRRRSRSSSTAAPTWRGGHCPRSSGNRRCRRGCRPR